MSEKLSRCTVLKNNALLESLPASTFNSLLRNKVHLVASNSTLFRWAWPPQLPLQVHLNLSKVHLVLTLLISHLEQINEISSTELSYLKHCQRLWKLLVAQDRRAFRGISKPEKEKHMNQSCLKLHARFETFTFLVIKINGRYVHVIKVEQKSAFERITATQSTGKESRSGLKTLLSPNSVIHSQALSVGNCGLKTTDFKWEPDKLTPPLHNLLPLTWQYSSSDWHESLQTIYEHLSLEVSNVQVEGQKAEKGNESTSKGIGAPKIPAYKTKSKTSEVTRRSYYLTAQSL